MGAEQIEDRFGLLFSEPGVERRALVGELDLEPWLEILDRGAASAEARYLLYQSEQICSAEQSTSAGSALDGAAANSARRIMRR